MMTDETLERRFSALWAPVNIHTTTIRSLEADVETLKGRVRAQGDQISTSEDTISSLRKRIAELEEKREEDDF